MFLFGLSMRGMMFTPESGDYPHDADQLRRLRLRPGVGRLYFAAAMFGYSQPDMPGDVHDYGTKFLVTAGLAEHSGHGGRLRDREREEGLMPKINLSHFEAAFLFSLFTSVVMGITSKKTENERLHYGAYCFGCFIFCAVRHRLGHEARPRLAGIVSKKALARAIPHLAKSGNVTYLRLTNRLRQLAVYLAIVWSPVPIQAGRYRSLAI